MVGILTYNIHSGVGTDGAYDLERVAGVIRRSKAEIACLQEAWQVRPLSIPVLALGPCLLPTAGGVQQEA